VQLMSGAAGGDACGEAVHPAVKAATATIPLRRRGLLLGFILSCRSKADVLSLIGVRMLRCPD